MTTAVVTNVTAVVSQIALIVPDVLSVPARINAVISLLIRNQPTSNEANLFDALQVLRSPDGGICPSLTEKGA